MNPFDYIVVGAGSAGSVLAWEIARRELGTVAVVESGLRATHSHSRIPALYPWLFRSSALCHNAFTTPQNGLAGRRIPLPAGKGLGGSSLLNAMIWSPPTRRNISNWSRCTNGEWSISEQLNALNHIRSVYFDEAGAIDTSASFVHPSLAPLLDLHSLDGRSLFSPYPRNIRSGRRVNAWDAFQSPAHAKRVTVFRGMQATKIRMLDNVAIGIEWQNYHSVSVNSIFAKRGVIVSSGALRTPELLLRSGIGPRDALLTAGIEPLIESPMVGQNLQDHLVFPVIYRSKHLTLPSRFSIEEIRRWRAEFDGALTSNIAELGSFIRADGQGDWLLTGERDDSSEIEFDGQLHATPTHYLEYPLREKPTAALSISITPLHPVSRGEIRITPHGEVQINPNYLSDPYDTTLFLRLVRAVRQLDLHNAGFSGEDEILPGVKKGSDEQVAVALSRFATTLYHYIGTCAVGSGSNSVCNAGFQVRGTSKLYVCDGSVLPSQPCGNTQVSVMMLAQLLANRLSTNC